MASSPIPTVEFAPVTPNGPVISLPDTLKTPDGKPFSQPKYCKPCRVVKKQMMLDRQRTPVSRVTALDSDNDQHECDDVDDDYCRDMQDFQAWNMTMSMATSP